MQEAIVLPPWMGFAVRPQPGIWEYVRINVEELMLEELTVSEYLGYKELLANGTECVSVPPLPSRVPAYVRMQLIVVNE